MIRLNPQNCQTNPVTHTIFPPKDDYFSTLLRSQEFQKLLETDATTTHGMKNVAKYYKVDKIWNDFIKGTSSDNPAWKYFMLLKIVKIFSPNDNLWISFVEGLHRHAGILICLTCAKFDYEDNNLMHDSLRNINFKHAGVPHFKESKLSPIIILNSIIKQQYDAPMLKNLMQVQVLYPKNKQVNIVSSMKNLKQMSQWISTNKKLSAEPTISKRLSEGLSEILTLSRASDRNTLRPKFIGDKIVYQTDMELKLFEKKCTVEGEKCAAGFPDILKTDEYSKYIKDPFNMEITKMFLTKQAPKETHTGHRSGGRHFPPFGISFKSLTEDVGIFDGKIRIIDVRHFNSYILVPRIVYTLSTKLKKEALHNLLGQSDEVQLIKFITRYGYATRGQPFCKLHCAYEKYTNNINKVNYINNCDGWHGIIPVTVFLVMLFNACLLYQPDEPDEGKNLLITALQGFDYGISFNDDTFMNTLSKYF
jgi:hypothetical protein